jgi:choline dehydrogenase-like flavoprotein
VTDRDPCEPRCPETRRDGQTGESVFVIGSGFGGAVTACRLNQAGFDVHILERGRRYGPKDFPALPTETMLLPDVHRWTWQHGEGLWDILDLEEIISVQAAGYGGGSLVYANVYLRPPDAVFDARWPKDYQQGEALKEFYPLGGYMLDAAPVTEHAMFSQVVKADQLKKTMGRLGRTNAFFYPPIAVNREQKTSIGGRLQSACTGCGACCSGCPETAKNTLDYNYLAIAEKLGAHVHTQCEVTDIHSHNKEGTPGRDGWCVHFVDHLAGEKRCELVKHVFLCAGSVHSTRLLARARLPSVELRVGIGYFPGGDAIGVVYDTANEQYPSFGPAITTTTVHWEPTQPATGTTPPSVQYFLLQDGGYAQELERAVGLLRAPAWTGRNRFSESKKTATTPASPYSRAADEQRPTGNPIALPSIADDVFKAVVGGGFLGAIPQQLLANAGAVLKKEVAPPLLVPAIVTSVIDGAIRAFFEKWFLTRELKQDGWFVRLLARIERRVIRYFFGTDEDLAARALRSALTGAGLSRDQWTRQVLGYDASNAKKRVMLLAMGRDAARGALLYYRDTDRLVADLDLFHLAPGYANQERLMTDVARELGGELRTNPAWAFLGKPITVHNQGGCPMSDNATEGVTDPDGKVHGCEGLFVLDGSILCTSVGVNPSATITAVAERNVRRFIRSQPGKDRWPEGDGSEGAKQYARQWDASRTWGHGWTGSPPDATQAPPVEFKSKSLGVKFPETLEGYHSATIVHPGHDDDRYLVCETDGRPSHPVTLDLTLRVADLTTFFEDETHAMTATGTLSIRLPGAAASTKYCVTEGEARILTPRFKPYGLPDASVAAQELLGGKYTTKVLASSEAPHNARKRVPGSSEEPEKATPRDTQRFFYYRLWFADDRGQHWTLYGYKRVRDNPAIDAWRDTSTLFVTLFAGHLTNAEADGATACRGAGAVHAELTRFLFTQVAGLTVTGTDDPARIAWGMTSFAYFFFGSLLRIYSPAVGAAVGAVLGKHRDNVITEPHRPPWRRWGR